MYPRKFSLNKPNFVLRSGILAESEYLLLRYISHQEFLKFCIVASNKFSKKAVIKNKVKRSISIGIQEYISEPHTGLYVFIPKKRILGQDGKIHIDAKKLGANAYSLLSKVAVS